MAGQSFLSLVGGKFARIFALQASAGASSAGAVVALNVVGYVDQTMIGPHAAAKYTVAALPTTGNAVGQLAYATNGRTIIGVGTLGGGFITQASGAGSGCLASWNGSVWQVAGTNVTVAA